MKVQELIDRLADFRGDAEVVFCHHNPDIGMEYQTLIESVSRTNLGVVGINWFEDAHASTVLEDELTDE